MVGYSIQQLQSGYNALVIGTSLVTHPLILSRLPSQFSIFFIEPSLYTALNKNTPTVMSSIVDDTATKIRNMSADTSLQTVYGSTHAEGRGMSFKARRSNIFFFKGE